MSAFGGVLIAGAYSIVRGRRPGRAQLGAYAIAGILSVVLMSGANFELGSDFRWLLVAPVLLWLAVLLIVGRREFEGASR